MTQSEKCVSRIRVASGAIASQKASGDFEMVMKSADMNTLVTPAISRSSDATGSSVGAPAAKLCGVANSAPTVNLSAFGFGVGATDTGIDRSS